MIVLLKFDKEYTGILKMLNDCRTYHCCLLGKSAFPFVTTNGFEVFELFCNVCVYAAGESPHRKQEWTNIQFMHDYRILTCVLRIKTEEKKLYGNTANNNEKCIANRCTQRSKPGEKYASTSLHAEYSRDIRDKKLMR